MDIALFILIIVAGVGYMYYSRFQQQLDDLRRDLRKRDDTQAQLERRLQLLEETLRHTTLPAAASPLPKPPLVVATSPAAPPAPAPPVTAPPPVVAPPIVPAVPVLPPAPRPAAPTPVPAPVAAPLAAAAPPVVVPEVARHLAPPVAIPPVVAPKPPMPAGPTWWDRVERLLLENWTGILGAVVLVTGVGFLGIYTALRLAPVYRFLLITSLAVALLGSRVYLRRFAFAEKLSVWLQSSAAAIFLFACVGSVSIAGLRWAEPPLDYLLLFAGVALNLYLAWTASRESVATLHGVLSLVSLAVLPPTVITLAAATGVTVFSISITYRERWKYQLLLTLVSFFCFHLYWHAQVVALSPALRLVAMGLVLLVGVAAALVQYRRIYAQAGFVPLLFVAHLLNWTFLGINLYLYSTGSRWKTIPLGLGAIATFFVARHARRLGIRWLFRTDTLISLALALATALSLQGWQASGSVVLLFVLLEMMVVAVVMARENEPVVFQVASIGLLLTAAGQILLNAALVSTYTPAELYRHVGVLLLSAGLVTAYFRWLGTRPRPTGEEADVTLSGFASEVLNTTGVAGSLLAAGAAGLLSYALHQWPQPPITALLVASTLVGAGLLGLAAWVRPVAGWLARVHIGTGQLVLLLTIMGLHQAGMNWPSVGLILYLELLVAAAVLGWKQERLLLRLHVQAILLGTLVLPIVVHESTRSALPTWHRATVLLVAAFTTLVWQLVAARRFPAFDELPVGPTYKVRLVGASVGWLLLTSCAYYYSHAWLGWAAAPVLAGLLVLRRYVAAPGVWAGAMLATLGLTAMQWSVAFDIHRPNALQGVLALRYLVPLVAVAAVGLRVSWVAAQSRYVRWPWLYLLGAQLLVLTSLLPGPAHYYFLTMLLWLGLAGVACIAAIGFRHSSPTEAEVARQGYPDRYLLHLGYAFLGLALCVHVGCIMPATGTAAGIPEHRLSALAMLVALAGVAALRPPMGLPQYRSWRVLHPWLPEAALGLWTLTLLQELRGPWYGPFLLLTAFLLTCGARHLPERVRRMWAYGRLYYWLAAGAAAIAALRHLSPAAILTLDWWAVALTAVGLFGYAALTLVPSQLVPPSLPTAAGWLRPLTHIAPKALLSALLYPAFVVLSLLLIQSFDRSVLTVLLTLECVAVFGTSIALRRRDMRYVALAGVLVCLVRLVFFDLSQRDTFTRALVFIFMGLLLLGMNGLYSRFKARFEAADIPDSLVPPAADPPVA